MIALIGEKELWLGFVPLGVKVFEVTTKDQVLSAIDEVKKENIEFLFLSEYAAKLIENLLDDLYKSNDFNVVLLPSSNFGEKDKKEELYFKRLKSVVEKAMGVDILSE